MTKTTVVKWGQSKKERRDNCVLFRNVIRDKQLGANFTHLLPGSKTESFKHEGFEIHYVIKGEVVFHVGKEKFLLQEGDILSHDSTSAHWSKNTGNDEAIYLTISTPYTFAL